VYLWLYSGLALPDLSPAEVLTVEPTARSATTSHQTALAGAVAGGAKDTLPCNPGHLSVMACCTCSGVTPFADATVPMAPWPWPVNTSAFRPAQITPWVPESSGEGAAEDTDEDVVGAEDAT
jgi:hypothetical protein